MILLTALLLAHSWYPVECCSNQDCSPVPCASVTRRGDRVIHNGHWLPITEIKPSPDTQCHVCEQAGVDRMYCAWIPEANS